MSKKLEQQQGYSACVQSHAESQGGSPPLDPPGRSENKGQSLGRTSRPKRSENREQRLAIRLTTAEKARVRAMAEAEGVEASELVRIRLGLTKKRGDAQALAGAVVIGQAAQRLSRLAEAISEFKSDQDAARCLQDLREIRKLLKAIHQKDRER